MGSTLELQGRQIAADKVSENPGLIYLAMQARSGNVDAGAMATAMELKITGLNGEFWFDYAIDVPSTN
jgi:hypothetical protein